jgi:hypothetical protein
MLSITYKTFMLGVIILNFDMLSVDKMCAVTLFVVVLSAVLLCVAAPSLKPLLPG